MKQEVQITLLGQIRLLELLIRNDLMSESFIENLTQIKKINESILSPFLNSFFSNFGFKHPKVLKKALLEIIKEPTLLALSSHSFIHLISKKSQIDSAEFKRHIKRCILGNNHLAISVLHEYINTTDDCSDLQIQTTLQIIFTYFLGHVYEQKGIN